MLKLLVLLMIHDYIQRYLMLKIVTHYSQISIVYVTGQKLTTWFLTPQNLSIYLFQQMYLLLVIMLMVMLAQNFYITDNVSNLKDLGITMSTNCSFEQHIIELCKRCTGLCGWILRTFSSRESTIMMTLFKSLVLSRLDYGSQLWSPTKIHQIIMIEKIQKAFTKHIK